MIKSIHEVLFYGKNWNSILKVIRTFGSSDSSAIHTPKDNLCNSNLQKLISEIENLFLLLPGILQKLEIINNFYRSIVESQ